MWYNRSWLSLNETKPKPLFTNVTLKSSTKTVLRPFIIYNLESERFQRPLEDSDLFRLLEFWGLSPWHRVQGLIVYNSDYLVYLSCSWKALCSAYVLKGMENMKNSRKKQCFRPYGEQSAILRKSINKINPCATI